MSLMVNNLLSVQHLTMNYQTRKGDVSAVDDVSFNLVMGQSLGLVGESGCGKTSIAFSLLRLLPENGRHIDGKVLLNGDDILAMDETEIRKIRWRGISMVFQSAMNALDPVYRVGDQIVERAETEDIKRNPLHPYTKALFSAVPIPNPRRNRRAIEIKGGSTTPIDPPWYCRFYDRCMLGDEFCHNNGHPPLENKSSEHWVACYKV